MLNGSFDCQIKFNRCLEIVLHIAFKLCSGAEFLYSNPANREFTVTYFTHHIQCRSAADPKYIRDPNSLVLSAQ